MLEHRKSLNAPEVDLRAIFSHENRIGSSRRLSFAVAAILKFAKNIEIGLVKDGLSTIWEISIMVIWRIF